MKILLVHQNFPAQFVHLGPELARRGHEVAALSMIDVPPMPGVTGYRSIAKVGTKSEHQWALDTEAKLIRAHAATVKASAMRRDGYVPDVIVAHRDADAGGAERLVLDRPRGRAGGAEREGREGEHMRQLREHKKHAGNTEFGGDSGSPQA